MDSQPAAQGSSVGLNRVEDETEWGTALADSLQYGGAVLCGVQGRELTVGVLDGAVLPVVEVRPKAGGYNYENKYTSGATDYFCPADLPNEVAAHVQALGLRAFEAVGARDFGRVDVMLNAEFKPYVLEVNTLPGMTETSLLPKAAAVAGMVLMRSVSECWSWRCAETSHVGKTTPRQPTRTSTIRC